MPSIPGNNCVLRLRYNISLPDDLDWFANKSYNNMFKKDPLIKVDGVYLRLALETNQLPRTFEDRSYTFDIIPRPLNISNTSNIYNINVMGKRGNIAQVRNCIEYDFVPNNITIYNDDFIHFQWVGSDFNPLGNEGEGRAGTDRSNLVDITSYIGFNMTQNNTFIPFHLINSFIYLNQNNCYTYDELVTLNKIINTQDIKNCALLNNASVYFNSIPFIVNNNNTNKTYYYMSTRNNNFSNRNQKGVIILLKKQATTILPKYYTSTNTGTSTIEQTTNGLTEQNPILASSSDKHISGDGIIGIIVGIIVFIGIICSVIYYRKVSRSNPNILNDKINYLKRSLSSKV
jgi:hypothetical protein